MPPLVRFGPTSPPRVPLDTFDNHKYNPPATLNRMKPINVSTEPVTMDGGTRCTCLNPRVNALVAFPSIMVAIADVLGSTLVLLCATSNPGVAVSFGSVHPCTTDESNTESGAESPAKAKPSGSNVAPARSRCAEGPERSLIAPSARVMAHVRVLSSGDMATPSRRCVLSFPSHHDLCRNQSRVEPPAFASYPAGDRAELLLKIRLSELQIRRTIPIPQALLCA